MGEIVLNTNSLPEPLFRMIRTEKVKVQEADGIIQLMPVVEPKNACPLRGIAADSDFTVAKYLASKQEEKELEL